MGVPSFQERLARYHIPHQATLVKDSLMARVIVDDDALTSEQAETLRQLIQDPSRPQVAITGLRILAEGVVRTVRIGNDCEFEGKAVQIYTYPPPNRNY